MHTVFIGSDSSEGVCDSGTKFMERIVKVRVSSKRARFFLLRSYVGHLVRW